MPKGYMSFDDFKSSKSVKEKKWRCPRCHRYVSDTVRNIFGKRMCIDCYYEEEEMRTRRITDAKVKETDYDEIQNPTKY